MNIDIKDITTRIQVRSLKEAGVKRLQEKIAKLGYLPQHPLLVSRNGSEGTYELLDGNHRLEAALALGLETVPIHIIEDELSDNTKKKLARQANEAAETLVPTTFVDDAELIWSEAKLGKTLAQIADILGWSEAKTKQYSALAAIHTDAWQVIVTTFQAVVTDDGDGSVTFSVTGVTFTEYLLRTILPLTPSQQLELVRDLAAGTIQKGKFKTLAENYRLHNQMWEYGQRQLGVLDEEYNAKLYQAVYSGAYDADWLTETHPKLEKLLAALREEWEGKHSLRIICGDFFEEAKKIGDGSVDLILTDPPYNISVDNEFTLNGRSNISQDFGEWDKLAHQEFAEQFCGWATEWARLLREQGSGYVFTSDRYLSYMRTALEQAGLHVKATLVWHKTNPGTQVVKTNFRSSVEYILFFTKGQGGHTFNWQGENEMHNFIEAPICGGTERLKDAKGNTLHPTQKPEMVIRHLIEVSSNRGDMIFDGFAGTFTTGAVAKKSGRKFIGIEFDQMYCEAGRRRME